MWVPLCPIPEPRSRNGDHRPWHHALLDPVGCGEGGCHPRPLAVGMFPPVGDVLSKCSTASPLPIDVWAPLARAVGDGRRWPASISRRGAPAPSKRGGLASPRWGGFGSFGYELQPEVGERVRHRHWPLLLDGVGNRSRQLDNHLGRVRLDHDQLPRGRRTRLPGLDDLGNRSGVLAETLLDQLTASIDPYEDLGSPFLRRCRLFRHGCISTRVDRWVEGSEVRSGQRPTDLRADDRPAGCPGAPARHAAGPSAPTPAAAHRVRHVGATATPAAALSVRAVGGPTREWTHLGIGARRPSATARSPPRGRHPPVRGLVGSRCSSSLTPRSDVRSFSEENQSDLRPYPRWESRCHSGWCGRCARRCAPCRWSASSESTPQAGWAIRPLTPTWSRCRAQGGPLARDVSRRAPPPRARRASAPLRGPGPRAVGAASRRNEPRPVCCGADSWSQCPGDSGAPPGGARRESGVAATLDVGLGARHHAISTTVRATWRGLEAAALFDDLQEDPR